MRIKKIEKFDPKKEYKIGERCIYNGMILVLKKWIPVDHNLVLKYNSPLEMISRCLSCRIKPDVCTGVNLQCDKFSRSDRKNAFWAFLRVADGYKKKLVYSYGYDGSINGVKAEAEKKQNK
jgi:hypothetical protein